MILPEGGNLSADLLSRVEYFVETYCQQHERLYRYGWGHLLFACYAAFPAHLTPDLLHKLRLNFRHYALSKTADETERGEIHPVAVNDLLLSNLVRETGFERYEMPEEIRHYLLWLLQHSGFFKKQSLSPIQTHEKRPREKAAVTRLNHLAAFLLRYTAEHYTASDPVTRSLREAQEWTAQAWLDPAQAARRIREKLSDEAATPNERYHFSRLGNRLGAQYALQLNPAASDAPASFSVLHTYAQGIAALYSGKSTQARAHFSQLPYLRATEGAAVASDTGTLRLPVPKEVVKQLLIDRPDLAQLPQPDAPERPREPKPLRWPDRETRLRSPHPKAVLAIADGDIKHILRALARMEKELREQLRGGPDFCLGDGYDVLVGSGIGAFVAVMLAARKKVADVTAKIEGVEDTYLEDRKPMVHDRAYAELLSKDFAATNLYAPLFLSGVVIANPRTDGKGFDFAHNLPDMDGASGTNLIAVHLDYAIAPPAGASTLNSLNLDATPLLLEARETLRWPAAPDDLFWVSVDTTDDHPPTPSKKKADTLAPAEVLHQHIQTDLRWLERHTFDLLGKHRLRYHDWDCSGKKEKGMEWPKGWYAVPPEPLDKTLPPDLPDIYVVITEGLNLRAGAGSEHKIVAKLDKGTRLEILSETSGWAQVRELEPNSKPGVREGWVSRQFIEPLTEQVRELKTKAEPKKAAKKTAKVEPPPSSSEESGGLRIQIQELIAEGRTEEALALLVQHNNDAVLLQARYNQAKKYQNMGMIDLNEWERMQSQVNYAALEMAGRSKPPTLAKSDAPSKKKKVYISYNHGDTEIVKQVRDYLEKVGVEVIFDQDDMAAGMSIQAFIQDSINAADAVVAIISAKSLQSGWVAQDFKTIITKHGGLSSKHFIPLTVDHVVFDTDFHVSAMANIEKRIREIDQKIIRIKELGSSSLGLEDDRKRLVYLQDQFFTTVDYLKSVLILDISGDSFSSSMEKVVKAIQSL